MDSTLRCLVSWIAPILCFTADEAWLAYTQDETDSIHLHGYADTDPSWQDDKLDEKWNRIRHLRSAVTTALETARNDGLIGGSLSAQVMLELSSSDAALFEGMDCAALFITSAAALKIADTDEVNVHVRRASGGKCARCWKLVSTISDDDETSICDRCEDVVAQIA